MGVLSIAALRAGIPLSFALFCVPFICVGLGPDGVVTMQEGRRKAEGDKGLDKRIGKNQPKGLGWECAAREGGRGRRNWWQRETKESVEESVVRVQGKEKREGGGRGGGVVARGERILSGA